MTGKLLKSVCPACGAPVSRAQHQKGFVCQFCGTEFYPDGEPDLPGLDETPITNFQSEYLDYSKPLDKSSQKRKQLGLWITIIVIGIISIVCLLGQFGINSGSTGRRLPTTLPTPVMLASLPKAEKAGTSVAFNNFELKFEPNVRVSDNLLYFNFTVQNWNNQPTVLRYKPNNFIVYDDLGNSYPLRLGNCDIDLPFFDRQIDFKTNEKKTFESSTNWCNRDDLIPPYTGVIPIQAKHLYLHIDEFGVFKDITFIFDL